MGGSEGVPWGAKTLVQKGNNAVLAHLGSDFLGVEVCVRAVVGVVLALELSDGSRCPDTRVVSVEGGVNHKAAVVHEAGIIHS